jgi:hypothetical protein
VGITRVRSILFLLLAGLASPLFAVNLVTNPSFNGSLFGWTLPGASTVYDATIDATGVPGSGSARSTTTVAVNQTALSQCIAVVPGTYTLSGKVFIPSGQSTTGQGIIGVTWFGGANCSSGPVLGFLTLPVATTGSFVTVSLPTTAPPGTTFAFVNAQHLSISNGTHVVNFDDISLDNGVPAPVPALEPSAMLVLMLALAALGAAAASK